MVVTVLCSVKQPGDINTVYPEWYLHHGQYTGYYGFYGVTGNQIIFQ